MIVIDALTAWLFVQILLAIMVGRALGQYGEAPREHPQQRVNAEPVSGQRLYSPHVRQGFGQGGNDAGIGIGHWRAF